MKPLLRFAIVVLSMLMVFATTALADVNMTGTVFDDDGVTAVYNAYVKVILENSLVLEAYTDSYGQYLVTIPSPFDVMPLLSAEIFCQKGTMHSTIMDSFSPVDPVVDLQLMSHPQCSDLVDNDHDGKIDYPADSQCQSSMDDSERSVTGVVGGTVGQGVGVGIGMNTEDFVPLAWVNPNRVIVHNRADGGKEILERMNNYAFEGEQIMWDVLVLDKNGIDKVKDVYGTISDYGQQPGDGMIEVNCNRIGGLSDRQMLEFNARILEESITTFDPETMGHYACILTVETPNSMYGEYFITIEVEDMDGNINTVDENEYFFLNPVLAVTLTGTIDFGIVRPGSNSYSDTLLIENSADAGSGVLLNMFISGSDFYDPANSGAKCPTSNVMSLSQLSYYATNGNYETGHDSARKAKSGDRTGGDEGYFFVPYENGNENSFLDDDMFGRQEIIEGEGGFEIRKDLVMAHLEAGNVLTPGAEIAITFRLALPEPCNGDFTDGEILFWGEAI